MSSDRPPSIMIEGGLSDDMIRLSVGLEDFDDIKADFEMGFQAAAKFAKTKN